MALILKFKIRFLIFKFKILLVILILLKILFVNIDVYDEIEEKHVSHATLKHIVKYVCGLLNGTIPQDYNVVQHVNGF